MMKKRNILYWAMGVILMPLLGSCTSDDVIGSAGREEHDITSGQPMTVTSETRAADGTQFENGEIVWMWANKSPGNSEYIKAWKLIADGAGGFSSGAAKYWPSDGSSLNVYALHGNFTTPPTEGTTLWNVQFTHAVETVQDSDDKRRLSDLLFSHPATAVVPKSTVQLAFDHLLAKITVKLDLSASKGIVASELKDANVMLTDIVPFGSFYMSSLLEGAGVSKNTVHSPKDITAGTITQPSDMSSPAYEVGSAIVPLQIFGATYHNKITITLTDGRSFSYTPADVTLAKGNEYIYTLKIIKGKLSVSSITVNPFTTETTQEKNWPIYVGS